METAETRRDEQGFMLLAMIVAIFLILLALGIAAPKVAQDLRRDREVEAIHRGNQYVRAIQLYYRKFGHYPASMDALEKSNNIRFLRQQYVDPMTGKADWRLIHVGEAKTTVKGFFGQPLAGLPGSTGGLGSASSSSSNIGGSSPGGTSASPSSGPGLGLSFGSSTSGPGGLGGSNSPGGATLGGTTGGATGTAGATGSTGSSDSSSPLSSTGGISSQSAATFTGGGAPFVGVGIPKDGDSITVLNEQTSYKTWEFIYDPRIEQLAAAAGLLGGSSANSGGSIGSGGFGSSPNGFGSSPGINGPTSNPGGTAPGGTNPGSTTPGSSPSVGVPVQQ